MRNDNQNDWKEIISCFHSFLNRSNDSTDLHQLFHLTHTKTHSKNETSPPRPIHHLTWWATLICKWMRKKRPSLCWNWSPRQPNFIPAEGENNKKYRNCVQFGDAIPTIWQWNLKPSLQHVLPHCARLNIVKWLIKAVTDDGEKWIFARTVCHFHHYFGGAVNTKHHRANRYWKAKSKPIRELQPKAVFKHTLFHAGRKDGVKEHTNRVVCGRHRRQWEWAKGPSDSYALRLIDLERLLLIQLDTWAEDCTSNCLKYLSRCFLWYNDRWSNEKAEIINLHK